DPGGPLRLVGRGEGAPRHQHTIDPGRQQAAVGDLVDVRGRVAVTHTAAIVGRAVDVDGVAAQRDHVIELAARGEVVEGEDVVADDPAGLAHAYSRGRVQQHGVLEAGQPLPEEAHQRVDLAPSLDLAGGEVAHVGAVELVHAGRVDPPDARLKRLVQPDAAALHRELPRLAGLRDDRGKWTEVVRMVGDVALHDLVVDVRDPKEHGHRLREAVLAATLL